jgi:uncharacterized membrane protein
MLLHLWPYIWPSDRRDLKARVLFAAMMTVALLAIGGLGGNFLSAHHNVGQIVADDGGSGGGD